MGNILSLADPHHRVEKKDLWISCGHYRLKGEQEELEDEIAIDLDCGPLADGITFTSNLDGLRILQEKAAFVGLFDGHSGPQCAMYLADHLKDQIFESPNFPNNIPKALQETFLIVDNDFLEIAKKKDLKMVLQLWCSLFGITLSLSDPPAILVATCTHQIP